MEPELSRNFGYLETIVLVSHASPIGLLTLYCNIKLVCFYHDAICEVCTEKHMLEDKVI